MSDAKNTEPDDDLLEFLGGIDEVNDDSKESDFSDFLANTDIEKVTDQPPSRATRPADKEGNRE